MLRRPNPSSLPSLRISPRRRVLSRTAVVLTLLAGWPIAARPQSAVPMVSGASSALAGVSLAVPTGAAQRLATLQGSSGAADAGPVAASTPLQITLQFAQSPAQSGALAMLLAAQTDPASPSFRHWLTPEQFGAQFGVSDQQLTAITNWLGQHGLAVASLSPARTRLSVTGTASDAQAAFQVRLHRYTTSGVEVFANQTEPMLPAELRSLVATISGLDDVPTAASTRLTITAFDQPTTRARLLSTAVASATATEAAVSADPLVSLAALVDGNASPILTMTGTACVADVTSTEMAAYRALLTQAAAQGMTVLAPSACPDPAAAAFPATLSEAIAIAPAAAARTVATPGSETRPAWQAAAGLPADALRHEPDLTTPSITAFASTVATLSREVGGRLGNIDGTLYALATTPNLYTQPDHAADGRWEPATGLGTVNLETLLKVFPRVGVISTTTSLTSDNYNVHYGQAFTLTAQVQPSAYGNANPTGVVTFSSSTQGVLGSSSIDGSGRATFTSGVLPVGPNSITATYQGDGNYSSSASNPPVGVYISLVNATLAAVVNPSINVPYGAIATVTATVTLPYLLASPSGPVTAQISSGAPNSATLSPNPGSNSATANIDLNVPPPGHYSVQVTCQGTTNFQCQTPVNLAISVVKGYTNTSVAVTPASPQAGQPVSITATIVNSGNGTTTYTYGGAVTFFDSGRPIATVPVATNQATTQISLAGNRTHNLTATYTGDTNWNASTSDAVAVTPTILADALTLSSNVAGSTSLAGVNIIFTGTVSTNVTYSSGPTGTLTFFDTFNGAVVQLGGPTAIVPNGPSASFGLFTTTGLLPGVHSIYVQYSGDDNYAAATSPVLSLSLSSFSLTMTPSSLTVAQGKSAQVGVIVTNSGGFTGSVSLGCTPPSSSQASCEISPVSITGSGTATMTITTAAPAVRSGSERAAATPGLRGAATGLTLAAVLAFLSPLRRRRIPSLLALLLAAALSSNLGCGTGLVADSGSGSGSGGGTATSASPGTPLGTANYTITAAGSDGTNTVRRSFQYQVTVQ